MLLLLAVVQSEDARRLTDRLLEQEVRVTQINSTGGLFGFGNVVLLMGIEDAQYSSVLSAIQATCRTRTRYFGGTAALEPFLFLSTPMEVEVGGAVVFGVPVERRLRIIGRDRVEELYVSDEAKLRNGASEDLPGDAPESAQNMGEQRGGKDDGMKLIVAIVHADDADAVIEALLTAEHRLTRINTTGGFLRRGNATLLIGVEEGQVDEVIGLMQAACRPRSEAAPLEQGFPSYAATVFVLDTTHFARL